EVYCGEGRWRLRDLKSLNGTRLNGQPLDTEWELSPGDEFQVGRAQFLYVESLEELPEHSGRSREGESVSIKKRLGQTRFLTPQPESAEDGETKTVSPGRHSLSRDLALLYRLALDMGSATTHEDLVKIVLDGLLEAVPAEVGAVLTLKEGRELEVTA